MAGALIIGVGPGVGRAVAHRFARAGLPVALVARTDRSDLAPPGVPTLALTADVSDEAALRAALDRATAAFGVPEVVVYNAALIRPDRIGELPAEGQLRAWSVNVLGALTAAAHLAPAMADRGGGSFLVTGGMPEPKPEYVSLSLGKAAVRTLVTLLDQTYGAAGVHAASVTIDGPVAPGTPFDPDVIAEHYWRLHTQPRADWRHEVVHSGAHL
jgi:NAD(P)-dependent dehydrogenase (short-subunit alcohol dehydrogenase family)